MHDADNLPIRRPSMVAAGHWRDITITDSLDEAVATNGDGLALAATKFDSGDVRSFTYNELNAMVNRVAVASTVSVFVQMMLVRCNFRTGGVHRVRILLVHGSAQ